VFDTCTKSPPTQITASATALGYQVAFYHADGTGELVSADVGGAAQQDHFDWAWAIACPAADTNNPGSICADLSAGCPIPGDIRMWVYYRDTDLVPPDSWHRLPNFICFGPASPTTPMAAIQADVQRQFRHLRLPQSTITLQPARLGVVNLPVIAYANTPRSATFTVTALGTSATLVATPRTWTWHWGNDQATSTTHGPGAGYPTCRGATDTCAAHTYSIPGTFGPIWVSVDWTATYTIAGNAGTFTINDPVRVASASRDYQIDQAPGRLVSG
jgi:hypothetical protein